MDEETIVEETPEGQTIAPVEEQQDETLPISEQKPTEAEGELPSAVSERTKLEFEKLKSRNKEMAEKLNKLETHQYGKDVFESVYGQPTQRQTVPQVEQQEVPNFIDQNGYVDTEALKRSLLETNARASRAEQAAKQAQNVARQQEEKRQVKEAHDKFPWLDPSNKDNFDSVAFELTRDRLVRNMWEGKEQTLSEVAEEVAKFHTPSVGTDEIKEQAVTEYKEKQTAKAQASAVQTGKGQPREDVVRLDELRKRTQLGDQSALDERLKNI